ncbi:MAG: CAP domain-containing protein [candidate division FCPU426 bacterium]
MKAQIAGAILLLALLGAGCHPRLESRPEVKVITHADLGVRFTAAAREKETGSFLVLLNQYRKQQGLGPLAADRTLQQAAQWLSEDMAAHDQVGHIDSRRRDPFRRLEDFGYDLNTYKAENVAAGQATAAEVLKSWRDSPAHNANLLNPHLKFIGIGFTYRRKSRFGWYWATTFGGEAGRGPKKR